MSRLKARFKHQHPDLVRIFRLASYEWQSVTAHLRGRLSWRQRQRIRGLSATRGLKLHLACGGGRVAGWINLDATRDADIRVDLRRGVPLPDGVAELLFCEHFCDHLNFPDGISRFLRECHRLLAPGGRARFVLHDATDLMRACIDRDRNYFEVANVMRSTMMESVNFLFRFEEGHQFLYDFETFSGVLRDAGFQHVMRCRYLESELPALVLDCPLPSREVMSMYVEAVR